MGGSNTRRTLMMSFVICGAIFLFGIVTSATYVAEIMYLCFFVWLQYKQARKFYIFFAGLIIGLTFFNWYFADYFMLNLSMFKQTSMAMAELDDSPVVEWSVFSLLVVYMCYVALENAKNLEKLMTLSTVDPLTEILNRREFYHAALIELNRSQRYGFNMALFMIDIDNFKVINDTYGHVSGDRALRKLADTARQTLRVPDILARYGGEEFVVVMPQTSEREAILVADRLRIKIANQTIETREGSFNMTVSIGMTEFYSGEEMLEDAIERADQALYHAKKTGKNRVCISRQEGEPVTFSAQSL